MARLRDMVAALLFVVLASPAYAQTSGPQPDDHEEERYRNIAVLHVREGGTDLIVDELSKLEQFEVEKQPWFLEQVTSRGFKAARVMTRPDNLRWVMRGAEIAYVIHVVREKEAAEDAPFEVRIVSHETGEAVEVLEFPYTADGLTAQHASQIKDAVVRLYEAAEEERRKKAQARLEAEAPATAKRVADEEDGTAEEEDPFGVAAFKEAERIPSESRWLYVQAAARTFKREMSFSGLGDTLLSYRSAIFPGYSLAVEGYPFFQARGANGRGGLYARFQHGFDSFNLVDGGETTSVSAMFLHGEAGLAYRFHALSTDPVNPSQMNFAVRAGAGYTSHLISNTDEIPSMSGLSGMLGVSVAQAIVPSIVSLAFRFDAIPYRAILQGRDEFGESAYSYGAQADLSALVRLWKDLHLTGGYGVSVFRTIFQGEGRAGFRDADGFELNQGAELGLMYWW